MKTALFISALAISLLLAGCSDSRKPLDSGTVISGIVWQHSLHSPTAENKGEAIPLNAMVDIYESLVIIHLNDGGRQIVPLDYVTDLKLK